MVPHPRQHDGNAMRTQREGNYVDMIPFYKRIVGELFDKIPDGTVERSDNVHSFREILKRHQPHPPVVYGASEVGFTCLSPLDSEPVPGTISIPIPSREIRIAEVDGDGAVVAGETGELLVHSETLPQAYWNKPEETAASFVEIDGKIWYRTKDYVRLGENGLIRYVDRAADVITYKGYVGRNELLGWCRESLAAYKVPKYIEFRDMLPKSKVGKLLRREIRDEERRKAGS